MSHFLTIFLMEAAAAILYFRSHLLADSLKGALESRFRRSCSTKGLFQWELGNLCENVLVIVTVFRAEFSHDRLDNDRFVVATSIDLVCYMHLTYR